MPSGWRATRPADLDRVWDPQHPTSRKLTPELSPSVRQPRPSVISASAGPSGFLEVSRFTGAASCGIDDVRAVDPPQPSGSWCSGELTHRSGEEFRRQKPYADVVRANQSPAGAETVCLSMLTRCRCRDRAAGWTRSAVPRRRPGRPPPRQAPRRGIRREPSSGFRRLSTISARMTLWKPVSSNASPSHPCRRVPPADQRANPFRRAARRATAQGLPARPGDGNQPLSRA